MDVGTRKSMFFVRFIRHFVSPCFGSLGALLHTGPHMWRSWGNLVFHWFYKDSLADPRVPGWGVQQPDCFRSEAPPRVLLVFPMFSTISGSPCSDSVAVFFLPSRKPVFYKGFGGFWVTVIFLPRLSYVVLKR